jgi:hypothetical protein
MGLETATIIQLVGAAAAVGGTVASQAEAGKTRRRQAEQNKKISATNAAKAVQARRQALREERVRRAQLMAQAEAAGFGGSSTAISGEALSGTIAAQQTSNVSSQLNTADALSAGSQAIADSQQRQQLFNSVASIGSSVFSSSGGPKAALDLFK